MTTNQTEFFQLWPTLLAQRQLNDFLDPTRSLLKLIREMDKKNRNITTEYIDQNPLNLVSHPYHHPSHRQEFC